MLFTLLSNYCSLLYIYIYDNQNKSIVDRDGKTDQSILPGH